MLLEKARLSALNVDTPWFAESGHPDEDQTGPSLLHHFFERHADEHPDAPAVVFGGGQAPAVTYGELERDANRLARWLRGGCGVQPGRRVALLLPKGSREAYTALLALLKTGASYVPLDPGYPAERIATILAASGASVLLGTASLVEGRFGGFAGKIVPLDGEAERAAVAAQSPARLPAAETGTVPSDVCYIIFTSGSTGQPKGVQIEHRNVVHFVRAEQQIFAITPTDRVYQGFSLAFDASVEELWLAWANGAALVAGCRGTGRACRTSALGGVDGSRSHRVLLRAHAPGPVGGRHPDVAPAHRGRRGMSARAGDALVAAGPPNGQHLRSDRGNRGCHGR